MRTESLIFSQLMTNEEYYKIFFKIYSRYFQKHNCIPSRQAMFVEIENLKGSVDIYKSLIEVTKETETFTENLEYLIETTEKFCKERAVYNALREAVLIADGQDKKKSADAIPSILQEALSVCFDNAVGHDYIEDSDARYEYYHAAEAKIPSGVREFDKVTKGGFSRKTLNLLLAPPHGGKSLIMVNMGCGALLAGFDVLFITLEMSDMEMSRRFDVNLMDVDFDTLDSLTKDIYKNKFSQIAKKSQGKLIVKEYPTGAAHAGHFKALMEELRTKQNFVPDLVIVDYMGICASEKYKAAAGANSYTILKSVGEELRALASEYNVAVVSAIQTNRSGIGNSEIGMSEMSESIGPAMTSDFIAAVVVSDELKTLKQILIKLVKNRYAGLADDKFLLGVDYLKMKLFDLEESASTSFKPKKPPRIETAADTFFDAPVIKTNSAFEGFSFD